MDPIVEQLRRYYDAEAARRSRPEPSGDRVELRRRFIRQLQTEARRSVVDLGAGPGLDGEDFVAAGLRYVGLDLAAGNGRLAAERGLDVVAGSLLEPPFPARSFDAGWSMSTLQHVPDRDVERAIDAMGRVLRRGAPLIIGLWGGPDREEPSRTGPIDQPRLYRLRTDAHVQDLCSSIGTVERFVTWPHAKASDWSYQVVDVRVG